MKISKRQLRQIIREEYTRLKIRKLLNENKQVMSKIERSQGLTALSKLLESGKPLRYNFTNKNASLSTTSALKKLKIHPGVLAYAAIDGYSENACFRLIAHVLVKEGILQSGAASNMKDEILNLQVAKNICNGRKPNVQIIVDDRDPDNIKSSVFGGPNGESEEKLEKILKNRKK